MEHLKYCLKEILIIKSLIEIDNSNFYKRSLARLIAIRIDDFIKLSFTLNKSTVNKQNIKDDLNTLQDYYVEYFKTQRDKFGAHFQELDFSKRLELWSNIDFEKTDFFSSIPLDIYNNFSTVSGFQRPDEIFNSISSEMIQEIKDLNIELDIEKYPNFSSDILSLTRYNSGGIIPCSKLQVKAGVLKSLEIINNYNIALFELTKKSNDISNVIKKIFITDVVSYCDNFITRNDLPEGAKQEEDGLDKYIDENQFPNAYKIINNFLENFKFNENLEKIRDIRNKSCGHIDKSINVNLIQNEIQSIKFKEIKDFYLHIKKTYSKICKEELVFQTFRLEPTDRAYGIQKLVGMPVKPFKKDLIPETEFISDDINEIGNYEIYFNLLMIKERHEEARHFFWESFSNSEIIEKLSFIVNYEHLKKSSSIDYRKAHKFFYDLLKSKKRSTQEKIQTIQLFIECRTGFPNTLLYILLDTYEVNKNENALNLQYLFSIGELCSERDDKIFELLKSNLIVSEFYKYYNALLSIYKIDIKARQKFTIDVNDKESQYSKLIKSEISKLNWFLRITISLSFSSELYFSLNFSFYRKALKGIYLNYFERVFKTTLKKHLTPLIKKEVDKRKVNKIIETFNSNRYSTLLGLLGDFLNKKKHKKEAENCRALLYEGIVKYAYNDNTELHNFGVLCFEMGNIELAVRVAESIVDSNPSNIKYCYFLLSLYLRDKIYQGKFELMKKYVLNNFKLKDKDRKAFEILEYQ